MATGLTTHKLPALLAEEELSEGGGDGLPSVQALFPPIDDDIPEEVQHQVGRLATAVPTVQSCPHPTGPWGHTSSCSGWVRLLPLV